MHKRLQSSHYCILFCHFFPFNNDVDAVAAADAKADDYYYDYIYIYIFFCIYLNFLDYARKSSIFEIVEIVFKSVEEIEFFSFFFYVKKVLLYCI